MKRCALIIGHRKKSPGAVNLMTGMNEFLFNDALARDIKKQSTAVDIQIVHRKTYRQLPDDINSLEPDFSISLHANAYDCCTSGTETLFYHKSHIGRMAAQVLQQHLVSALELPDRGIKPKSSEERGGYLLRYTDMPCLIAEPFFIDHTPDLKRALARREELIQAYVNAIEVIAESIQETHYV